MTVNQMMFIYAVEEMSFSHAAERACVTQQCLSNHIQRLEKSYGVKLFERSPHLKLTPAGTALYKSFIQIRDIEDSTREKLQSEDVPIRGTIRFGTHLNRSHIFIPEAFKRYHIKYPEVQLCIDLIHTQSLHEKIASGIIDVGLTANSVTLPGFNLELVGDEKIIFIVRRDLLKKCIPDWDFTRNSISPDELAKIPMTASSNMSIMKQNLDHYMTMNGLGLTYLVLAEGHMTQLGLCKQGICAMFCPEYQLFDLDLEKPCDSSTDLKILLLKGYNDHMKISLVTAEERQMPVYIRDFCDCLICAYQEKLAEVRKYQPTDFE